MSRALVGLGEGVAPSGATDMVARVIAKNERSRAISFIFSGLHVGSLLGLLVAPPLIENFGWETVFYIFGIAGGRASMLGHWWTATAAHASLHAGPGYLCNHGAPCKPLPTRRMTHAGAEHRAGTFRMNCLLASNVSLASIAGLVWVLWFQTVMAGIEQREPDVARALSEPAEGGPTGDSAQVRD